MKISVDDGREKSAEMDEKVSETDEKNIRDIRREKMAETTDEKSIARRRTQKNDGDDEKSIWMRKISEKVKTIYWRRRTSKMSETTSKIS